MEPHKKLELGAEKAPNLFGPPVEYFKDALEFAKKHYGNEIERISSVSVSSVDPEFFFKEYIWVVHATGFSAKAVSKFMDRLLKAYGPWETLADESFEDVMGRVKLVCNNQYKALAVQKTAKLLTNKILPKDGASKEERWEEFKKEMFSIEELTKLPYIGGVTCYHLGRNIGLLDCVKPDLHLVRMADHWGYANCVEMCKDMSRGTGLPLGIVDLVLWYSASHWGTIDIKKSDARLC